MTWKENQEKKSWIESTGVRQINETGMVFADITVKLFDFQYELPEFCEIFSKFVFPSRSPSVLFMLGNINDEGDRDFFTRFSSCPHFWTLPFYFEGDICDIREKFVVHFLYFDFWKAGPFR